MRDWVALNMTPGIGPRAAAKLLERFGSAEAVYRATRAELEKVRLLPEAVDSIIARDMHEQGGSARLRTSESSAATYWFSMMAFTRRCCERFTIRRLRFM